MNTFDPSILKAEAGGSRLEASLVYNDVQASKSVKIFFFSKQKQKTNQITHIFGGSIYSGVLEGTQSPKQYARRHRYKVLLHRRTVVLLIPGDNGTRARHNHQGTLGATG